MKQNDMQVSITDVQNQAEEHFTMIESILLWIQSKLQYLESLQNELFSIYHDIKHVLKLCLWGILISILTTFQRVCVYRERKKKEQTRKARSSLYFLMIVTLLVNLLCSSICSLFFAPSTVSSILKIFNRFSFFFGCCLLIKSILMFHNDEAMIFDTIENMVCDNNDNNNNDIV